MVVVILEAVVVAAVAEAVPTAALAVVACPGASKHIYLLSGHKDETTLVVSMISNMRLLLQRLHSFQRHICYFRYHDEPFM